VYGLCLCNVMKPDTWRRAISEGGKQEKPVFENNTCAQLYRCKGRTGTGFLHVFSQRPAMYSRLLRMAAGFSASGTVSRAMVCTRSTWA
jgi:hypothetical protein